MVLLEKLMNNIVFQTDFGNSFVKFSNFRGRGFDIGRRSAGPEKNISGAGRLSAGPEKTASGPPSGCRT
jgi:hypothetical protein